MKGETAMLRRNHSEKGFTLIELLIVVAIIAILAAIAVPNFLEAQVRSKVSRVRNDLRSLATAIESYRVDNNAYPGSGQESNYRQPSGVPVVTVAYPLRDRHPQYMWFYTFVVSTTTGQIFGNLTTPVSYMTSIPADPFSRITGGPLGFYHTRNNHAWILMSMGPNQGYPINQGLDMDYDSEGSGSATFRYLLNPFGTNPTEYLVTGAGTYYTGEDVAAGAFTYDATNGTKSKGTIWRVGP
jgi:type II secretion system protein G